MVAPILRRSVVRGSTRNISLPLGKQMGRRRAADGERSPEDIVSTASIFVGLTNGLTMLPQLPWLNLPEP